jgi:DNA-binding PadR family transcriptional regulator
LEHAELTELEGAVLSEIHHRGQKTAFQVRRAFAASHSLEWTGSAGAVYPAVRRLEQKGFIHASAAEGGRATRRLSLTVQGRQALKVWSCNPRRASSVGIDPFRLRAGIWTQLAPTERQKLFAKIRREIASSIAILSSELAALDPIEHGRVEMALAMQYARLEVLEKWGK